LYVIDRSLGRFANSRLTDARKTAAVEKCRGFRNNNNIFANFSAKQIRSRSFAAAGAAGQHNPTTSIAIISVSSGASHLTVLPEIFYA
jgi:hypothetical protein